MEEGPLDQPGGPAARRPCQAARRREVELRLQACRYCICPILPALNIIVSLFFYLAKYDRALFTKQQVAAQLANY